MSFPWRRGETAQGRFYSSILRDITERKQAAEALYRAHEMLRMVLDTIPQRVFWKDRDATYLGANMAFAREAGVSTPEAIVGKRDTDLTWSALAERLRAEDRQIIAGNTSLLGIEDCLTARDGTRTWQRTSKVPLHDQTGAVIGVLGVYEDFTAEKQAQEKLYQTLEELTRSNAELERFAYIASHDLQEPLRMVASFVQLLGDRYRGRLDADADDFIGFAIEGAERMHNLINDLLAYSRVGTNGRPFVPTAMMDALTEVLWNLMQPIEDSGAIITHDPLPVVLADPPQLVQVLQNLIGNAIKFRGPTPPVVHVAARLITEEGRGPSWLISIQDNGIGIAPEYHETHLWDLPTPACSERIRRHRHWGWPCVGKL